MTFRLLLGVKMIYRVLSNITIIIYCKKLKLSDITIYNTKTFIIKVFDKNLCHKNYLS